MSLFFHLFLFPRSMSGEKALLNKLLLNYDRVGRAGRPVLNVSTAVDVFFGLGLIQMDLNEKEKILTMSMWTRYVSTSQDMEWKLNSSCH